MNRDDYFRDNRSNWDERVSIHAESKEDVYDIEGFLAGGSTLKDIEIRELGDVKNRTLLHMMCHFGLDTLSWARRGAEVTGVDFSRKAVALARDLAKRSDLDARFLCADVYAAPNLIDGRFDIVFASYGVLCWLPDLDGFMRIVGRFLKPGGTFLLVDGHPFFDVFEYVDGALDVRYAYFHSEKPDECVSDTSYVNTDRKLTHKKTHQWTHDVGSILNAVVNNGMDLLSLKEYPYGFFQKHPNMVRDEAGRWILEGNTAGLPLIMSVKAHKRM